MTQLIVRIKYVRTVANTPAQLQDFFQYTIKSLVQQTDRDFVCFINYLDHNNELSNCMKANKFKDPRFVFTQNYAVSSHEYINQQNLDRLQDIRFIELKSNQVYPKNMLARIRASQYSTKVQFLNGAFYWRMTQHDVIRLRFRAMDAFVYVCPIPEYRRLFFYFDERNHDSLNASAIQMPRITLPIPYMQYSHTLGPEGAVIEKEDLDPILSRFGIEGLGR